MVFCHQQCILQLHSDGNKPLWHCLWTFHVQGWRPISAVWTVRYKRNAETIIRLTVLLVQTSCDLVRRVHGSLFQLLFFLLRRHKACYWPVQHCQYLKLGKLHAFDVRNRERNCRWSDHCCQKIRHKAGKHIRVSEPLLSGSVHAELVNLRLQKLS